MGLPPEGQRQLSQMREVEVGPSRSSSVTFLKNKATKPNLAPVPTPELSIRLLRPESSASGKKETSVVSEEVVDDVDAAIPEDGVIC